MLRRVLGMPRSRTGRTYEDILGYGKAELRTHLEAQFTGSMSWSSSNSFHVDHKMPIAVLAANGVTDPRIVNALANLQVLTPKQNQEKNAKYSMENFQGDLRMLEESVGVLA